MNCSAVTVIALAKRVRVGVRCNSRTPCPMVRHLNVQSTILARTRCSKCNTNPTSTKNRRISNHPSVIARHPFTAPSHVFADTNRLLCKPYTNHASDANDANDANNSLYLDGGPNPIGGSHLLHQNEHARQQDAVHNNINSSNKGTNHNIQGHCPTCRCRVTSSRDSHNTVLNPMTTTLITDTTGTRQDSNPLPPPLPEPRYSVHKRILPPHLIALSSPQGRHLLLETLASTPDSPYWSLSEHFQNQSEPAYCGVTTLVMVLNSMSIDPQIRWKGGWRYYGSEDVLLSKCTECLSAERIRRVGITMEEFKQLAHCQGLRHVSLKRPIATTETKTGPTPSSPPTPIATNISTTAANHSTHSASSADRRMHSTIDEFRNDLKQMTMASSTTTTANSNFAMNSNSNNTNTKGTSNGTPMTRKTTIITKLIVTSFSRAALGQTGDGHFSPIGAYHESSDSVLIMDVARFKYPPYWVPVQELFHAMIPKDPSSHLSRGWFTLMNTTTITNIESPSHDDDFPQYHRHQNEHRRPAKLVPLVGQGDICPVGKIKTQFCKIKRSTTIGPLGDTATGRTQE